ncbi:hypothetical protein [Actinomycetospora chiangmaiensis]|uniref:hypothetical protein n=1 Tax=Actinomycetospora chiangmaiensis TaxID=402650 RepID=UPI00039BEAB3|nr:hypothetical protein [Actinomycetospora chiangmaiensis]
MRPTDVFETAETLFEHEFDGAAFAIPAVAAIPVPITATVTAARLTMFFTMVPPVIPGRGARPGLTEDVAPGNVGVTPFRNREPIV